MASEGAKPPAKVDEDGGGENRPHSTVMEAELSAVATLAELIRKGAAPEAILSALQVTLESTTTLQSTSGAYPPPAMMDLYREIDPAINHQILNEARVQGEHRRELEKLSTQRSEDRQDAAQTGQTFTAVLSLIAAVGIIVGSLWFTKDVSWPAALAAALIGAIGVGGRPAATIFTSYIGKRISAG